MLASYQIPVRQYRDLQSRFLQCSGHPEPPCDLLMLRAFQPAHKGLEPSRQFQRTSCFTAVVLPMLGTHTASTKQVMALLKAIDARAPQLGLRIVWAYDEGDRGMLKTGQLLGKLLQHSMEFSERG